MEITLNIKAKGLEGALNNLASAMGGSASSATVEAPVQQAVPTQQPQQESPVQQVVPQQPSVQQAAPSQQQAPVQAAPPHQASVPTSAPAYTMEQLAVAATQLVDAGKRDKLIELLGSFSVNALTELPKEQYGAFATKLRELGANL